MLTVILLVEGFTIFDVRGYITLHTVLGLVLFGPVALKCAVTMYRFGRYYTGRAAYVRRGPPPMLLRVMGPLLILSSLAVLGTGVALLVTHGRSDGWLTLHQGSFIVWVVLAGVHFLWHLADAVRGTARDLRRRANGRVGAGACSGWPPSRCRWSSVSVWPRRSRRPRRHGRCTATTTGSSAGH